MIKLTKDNILTLYKIMVDNTGGTIGIRDTSLLESALNAPFQTFGDEELYPSIIEKASRLCYGLIKNHPFIDGNKRIGVYAMLVFLELNNLNLNFSDEEIINIALKTADSSYSYDDILGVLKGKEII
jgi:death-on-curing protein